MAVHCLLTQRYAGAPAERPVVLVRSIHGGSCVRHGSAAWDTNLTFDTFAVGEENRTTLDACVGLAEQRGEPPRRLFLHGPGGAGKSHLLHAVANLRHSRFPGERTVLLNWATVCRDAEERGTLLWPDHAGAADLLLVDGIDNLLFLAGTDGASAGSHWLRKHVGSGSDLVLTSSGPPGRLNWVEGLGDVFRECLAAPLRPPGFETRASILRLLAGRWRVDLAEADLLRLAEGLPADGRMLQVAVVMMTGWGYGAPPRGPDPVGELLDEIQGWHRRVSRRGLLPAQWDLEKFLLDLRTGKGGARGRH